MRRRGGVLYRAGVGCPSMGACVRGRGRGRGRGRAAIKTRSIVDSSEEEEAIPEVEDDDHSTVLK